MEKERRERAGDGPSLEEEDLRERSIKKPKGVALEDEAMADSMQDKVQVNEEGTPLVGRNLPLDLKGAVSGRKVVSYKDKLLELNGVGNLSDGEEEDWMAIQRREEEEGDLEEEVVREDEDDPLCPTYRYSKADHKEDCKRWRTALIVKLLGRKISSKFLIARLLKMWSPVGTFEDIELDNGYILFKFHNQHDFNHVLHDGPWIVADHYVVVQRWRPLFDPYDESFKKMAVWLRIPGLPIELYSSHHLWKLGNMFGRTLKADRNSIRKTDEGDGEITEKAKFARICVEIDLRKSLVSKFKIGERVFHIGYEGLHLVCFACGQYGHRKDQCSRGMACDENKSEIVAAKAIGGTENLEQAVPAKKEEEEAFGGWMVVQRPSRGRKLKMIPAKQIEGGKVQNLDERFGTATGRARTNGHLKNLKPTSSSNGSGTISQNVATASKASQAAKESNKRDVSAKGKANAAKLTSVIKTFGGQGGSKVLGDRTASKKGQNVREGKKVAGELASMQVSNKSCTKEDNVGRSNICIPSTSLAINGDLTQSEAQAMEVDRSSIKEKEQEILNMMRYATRAQKEAASDQARMVIGDSP